MTQLLDCGNPAHDASCLCDVVVTEPTPINFGGHEVEHADRVIKYYRLGAPWSPDDLVKLQAGLDKARKASDLAKQFQLDPDRPTSYTEPIKQLIRQGHSMVDIPLMLGLSYSDAGTALMSGRQSAVSAWGEAEWLAFEADVYDGSFGRTALAKRNGIPPMTAKRLADLYSPATGDALT